MAELTPVTRLEMFLAGEELDPVTRIEKFLAGEALVPVTRQEMYLAAMGGQSVDLPDPVTRLELFLAKAAGMSVETPDPVTRIEMFLSEWSGGGVELTVSGNAPVTLANAIAHAIVSLTQEGKVTQASTPTPSAPKDIVCNNGALRFGALGQNLLNSSAANTVLGYYINRTDGEVKDSPYNFMFAGYMPVEAGKTYVAYGRAKNGNDLSDYNRVAWYDSTKTWIEGANYTQNQIAVVTAPNNAAFARFSCNPSGGTSDAVTQEIVDSYNWMFAEGTAEIAPFVPFVGGIYVDGTPEVLSVTASGATPQTASVADLYAVGNYKDTQEIIGGTVTRRVWAYVFDGTEQLSTSTAYGSAILLTSAASSWGANKNSTPLCTHFTGLAMISSGTAAENTCFFNASGHFYFRTSMSKTDFATLCATEYAAGTPIIVMFALATATTETVAGQHLTTAEGTNTVSVTSNVDPVTLTVVYKGTEDGGSISGDEEPSGGVPFD